MRHLDLNLLVALDALLDERSVTRAARRLGLTQSTVSGMLTRLRAALGDPLFVRSQHGIVPTRRASQLAAPLKDLIAAAKVIATAERFDPATASQTFSVSLNDYMQLTVLLPLVADLRRKAAGIRLSVRPLVVDNLAADLARGEIDLVVTIPEFAMSDLPSRLLYRETYVGVVRREHPLAGRLGQKRTVFTAPIYDCFAPRKQTFSNTVYMSAKCQKRTSPVHRFGYAVKT